MNQAITGYLLGLLLTYVASLVFAAIGWIKVDKQRTADRLFLPLLVAGVAWTTFFFAGKPLMGVIFSGPETWGGLLLAGFLLWFLSYAILKFAEYIAPPERLKFEDDLELVIIGLVYVVIYIGWRHLQDPTFLA